MRERPVRRYSNEELAVANLFSGAAPTGPGAPPSPHKSTYESRINSVVVAIAFSADESKSAQILVVCYVERHGTVFPNRVCSDVSRELLSYRNKTDHDRMVWMCAARDCHGHAFLSIPCVVLFNAWPRLFFLTIRIQSV